MPIRPEIRAVNNRQQQLHQTLRVSPNRIVFGYADDDRGGGDHELFLEGGGYVSRVGWRVDGGSEGVEEAVEVVVVVVGEEGGGEFVEKDEELELVVEGEVLAEKRGEEEIGERRIERAPFIAGVLEIVD